MYYFASDMHLGMSNHGSDTLSRERLLIQWLDQIKGDAKAIFLMGDVFDFWMEYNKVVPRGFVRFFAKLGEVTSSGVKVYFFTGNHDMWAKNYLNMEVGVEIVHGSTIMELDGKKVFLSHGDNLHNRSIIAKIMDWGFHNSVLRWIFQRAVHPDLAIRFGQWWSGKSRHSKKLAHDFKGEEEFHVRYSREKLKENHIDYFIYGHIHIAMDYDLGAGSRVIFLGEWIEDPTYAVMKDGEITLKKYTSDEAIP